MKDGVKINVIGAPSWLGCDRRGAETAPDKLRRHGIIARMQGCGCEVYDLGNLILPEPNGDKFEYGNMKYLPQILELNRNLAESVFASLSSGALPFVLGGDHSVALGSISGSGTFHRRLGVIWIDAHGDMNTDDTSPSGNIHGMCLASLMGFGNSGMTGLYSPGRKVDPQDVFLLGIRSLDPGEEALIEREGITVYTMDQIHSRGSEAVMDELLSKIRQRELDNIHCSLDIDVLDPSIAPGTGTTVENGMTTGQLDHILGVIADNLNVVSCDMVELNPLLDVDDKTTDLTVRIAGHISSRMIG